MVFHEDWVFFSPNEHSTSVQFSVSLLANLVTNDSYDYRTVVALKERIFSVITSRSDATEQNASIDKQHSLTEYSTVTTCVIPSRCVLLGIVVMQYFPANNIIPLFFCVVVFFSIVLLL